MTGGMSFTLMTCDYDITWGRCLFCGEDSTDSYVETWALRGTCHRRCFDAWRQLVPAKTKKRWTKIAARMREGLV